MLERIGQHCITHHYGDVASGPRAGQGCRERGHLAHRPKGAARNVLRSSYVLLTTVNIQMEPKNDFE
jgi:hypothetical protein